MPSEGNVRTRDIEASAKTDNPATCPDGSVEDARAEEAWALIDSLRERAEKLDPHGTNASQILKDAEFREVVDPELRDPLRSVAYARYRAARDHHAQMLQRLRQAEVRLSTDTAIYYFLEALTAPR